MLSPVYSWKANGQLHTCLAPRDLNLTIKLEHYRTPVVEKITPELAGSTHFTKLNCTSSYLCIVPDYRSFLLTIFNTPWWWYHYVCLPCGLVCAQDILQCIMDQILDHYDGVIGIADDVVVHGKDHKEHERYLHYLMEWLVYMVLCSMVESVLSKNHMWTSLDMSTKVQGTPWSY